MGIINIKQVILMGISIDEMLKTDLFKNYKVLAGYGGLNNHIQGVAVLDAPDGFNWTEGREFVITSGYVFKQDCELIKNYIKTEKFSKISGMGVKFDRYIDKFPDEIIKAFNEHNIPLISIPMEHSWMNIMNSLNVLVMNKTIRQFKIGKINPLNYSDSSYQSRKINKILSTVEYEMNFPAMIYDLSTETAYYSSPKFKEMSKDLDIEDFWNPSFNFSKEVLCDNLKMSRYRFYDEKYIRPFSWITIPIKVDDKVRAYFVVLEAIDLIDYFDQFAIRIGFLLIQSLYEQMVVAKHVGDLGFEEFVNNIIGGKIFNNELITDQASDLNLNPNSKYHLMLMEQTNGDISLVNYKEIIRNCIGRSFLNGEYRAALVGDNKFIFLFEENKNLDNDIESLQKKASNLTKRLELEIEDIKIFFAFSDISECITELKKNYDRCTKIIDISKYIFPDLKFCTYSQLGVFAWLDIKSDEFDLMLGEINMLLQSDDKYELIETLRVYLESKMNYSITAEKLFIHINTVRKRIEKINDLINIDLDNSINRLKLELILKLIC